MKLQNALHGQLAQLRSFSRPARLFLFATVTDGIVYSAWGLFFNFYILERGYSRGFLGLVNAIPSLAILLVGIPMGHLSDRIGRKRAMVLGVVLTMIFNALEITVRSPGLILACGFMAGATSSLYFLSQAPFMMKVSDDRNRTLLFSLNFGFVTLAGAVGNIFAGQLPGLFGGFLHVSASSAAAYQAVLLMSVALSFSTLIPLLLIREPAHMPAAVPSGAAVFTNDKGVIQPRRSSLWKIITQPLTLKLSLPNLMIGSGAAILIPYVNLFFVDRFHISDSLLGLLFSLSALLTGVGSIVGPKLATGLGSKIRAVVFTQAGSLAFLLLMGFSPMLGLVMVAFLFRGTLMNMAVPLFDAFAMEQTPEREQGTVNSVRSLAWQVGWTVGPFVSGLVQQKYGFTPLFVATSILYAGAITLTWVFFHKGEVTEDLAGSPQDMLPLESPGD